jgi:hypothetical protein
VVTVIRRGVPVEEAAAQMRAFVLMLESAKRADLRTS